MVMGNLCRKFQLWKHHVLFGWTAPVPAKKVWSIDPTTNTCCCRCRRRCHSVVVVVVGGGGGGGGFFVVSMLLPASFRESRMATR